MFIRNYLISVMVLVGMYVALDMVFNFGNLTQARSHTISGFSLWRMTYDIADYYFYQSFFFFVQLSGTIAVLAAGFTLMRLSRFNETTALLAAGTPLLRMTASIIIVGSALNLILLPVDQEIIIPRLIPKLIREHSEIHDAAVRTFPVYMMQDDHRNLFSAALYRPPTGDEPAEISYFDVIERNADLEPVAHIYAPSATWDEAAKEWILTDGKRVPIASPNESQAAVQSSVATYQSDITPEEIALNDNKDYIQFLSVSKINELLARPKSYGTIDLLRTRHTRFTQPIINVILLLLAISTVLTREPQSLKTSAIKCMILCGLCMGAAFFFYELAGIPPRNPMPPLWPALMAWLPIFIFGPLAVYMLDTIKS